MILRNGRSPRGVDLGPLSAAPAAPASVIVGAQPLPDGRPRENGRFVPMETEDPALAVRRRQWREAQQRMRARRALGRAPGADPLRGLLTAFLSAGQVDADAYLRDPVYYAVVTALPRAAGEGLRISQSLVDNIRDVC